MTDKKLTELLRQAYHWGRDNGSNRSEKNFNDLLQTEAINQALSLGAVVGRSEQLQGFFEFYKKKFGGGFNTTVLEITLKQYQETL